MAEEYELIEYRLQRAVRSADRNCRKVRRGNIPFSPMQKQLMGAITILRQMRLQYILKGKPNQPRMKKIRRTNLPVPHHLTPSLTSTLPSNLQLTNMQISGQGHKIVDGNTKLILQQS